MHYQTPEDQRNASILMMGLSCILLTAVGFFCRDYLSLVAIMVSKPDKLSIDQNLSMFVFLMPLTMVFWAVAWPKVKKAKSFRTLIIYSALSPFLIFFSFGILVGLFLLLGSTWFVHNISDVFKVGFEAAEFAFMYADIAMLTGLGVGLAFWNIHAYFHAGTEGQAHADSNNANAVPAEHMAVLNNELLKVFQVGAQKVEPDKLSKVFSADFYKVQINTKNSLNQQALDGPVVALRDEKVINVEELNANRYLTNLLSLVKKEYVLKSEADAKLLEAALDAIYTEDGSDIEVKAIRHESNKWTFVRGKYWEKWQGFIVTTNDNGVINAIRYERGIEET